MDRARFLPNAWGQGLLFAYSGWDGETNWADDFVCISQDVPFAWKVSGSASVEFWLSVNRSRNLRIEQAEIIANDVLSASLLNENGHRIGVKMAMQDCDTLVGEVIPFDENIEIGLHSLHIPWCREVSFGSSCVLLQGDRSDIVLFLQGSQPLDPAGDEISICSWPDKGVPILFAVTRKRCWEPTREAFEHSYRARLSFFDALPTPCERFSSQDHEQLCRTFQKAASVIKVNLHSPQGMIPFRWTTPDRVPHGKMWLWDSALHGIGLRWLDPQAAVEQLMAVATLAAENGFIPINYSPEGTSSDMTQPPILAWSAWEISQKAFQMDFFGEIYPYLKRFLEFFLRERDQDANGLCEWEHKNASGMDNSPRFDNGPQFDALDLNCFLANEFGTMARIAEKVGGAFTAEIDYWKSKFDEIKRNINALLWNEEAGFYYDRYLQGELMNIETVCGFLPLFAGVASEKQAERLIEHLTDEAKFWTPVPIPSVSKDELSYSKDMWRGPMWLNYNYFVIQGLRKYGYGEIADELVNRSFDEVVKRYLGDGVIFEYYDAEGETSPRNMPRKGKINSPKWIHNVVRDYQWSASVFLSLALESCQ